MPKVIIEIEQTISGDVVGYQICGSIEKTSINDTGDTLPESLLHIRHMMFISARYIVGLIHGENLIEGREGKLSAELWTKAQAIHDARNPVGWESEISVD